MKNVKITYRASGAVETDYIIVEPPFDFGDWLDNNSVHSEYDAQTDTYTVIDDNGEKTGETYLIITREETDEDLIG